MGQEGRMPRAFATRESHRKALNVHMVLLFVGLAVVFGINRFVTPDTFWAHWVALAWGVVFLGHLAIFAKGTLATMGGKKRDHGGPDE
jgi:hypothetical protein